MFEFRTDVDSVGSFKSFSRNFQPRNMFNVRKFTYLLENVLFMIKIFEIEYYENCCSFYKKNMYSFLKLSFDYKIETRNINKVYSTLTCKLWIPGLQRKK